MIKLWCVCWRQLDSAQHISLNWQLSWYGHDVMTTWTLWVLQVQTSCHNTWQHGHYGHYMSSQYYQAQVQTSFHDTILSWCHDNMELWTLHVQTSCHDTWQHGHYGHCMSSQYNLDRNMSNTCHHNIIKPAVIIQSLCSMSWCHDIW